ncbi:AfsR/SARP family transcriptional regulator [Paenibacillus oceani]|uniref:Bacterial transcriptional activator domain-containing protein n=1 Tax=Paenibacillus oceani TaxID=2772510 RepID=A0A927C941_9BACL|nr:BTAD domain-containing putative transcriptional regulator [Paenibacillus oceani]MBD2863684.1 hypothetical protein [Paenibacillus oceani]
MTLNEVRRWIDQRDYAMAVIRLECAILEGGRPDAELLAMLPDGVLSGSPLLQKAYGERLADAGRLAEAKELLQKSVKGFARQTFQQELLAAMASLAYVHMRMGELHEAETLLIFLRNEYEREETAQGGHVPLAIARGAQLIGEESSRRLYYQAAFDAFDRAADPENGSRVLLEMLLDLGPALGSRIQESHALLCLRLTASPAVADYEAAYAATALYFEERWEEASDAFAGLSPNKLPVVLDAALRCCGYIAMLRCGQVLPEEGLERLRDDVRRFAGDATIQFQYACLGFERKREERNEAGARRALVQAEALAKLCASAQARMKVQAMKRALDALVWDRDEKTEQGELLWNVTCFGMMKFTRGNTEVADFRWKRRKAQELLLYLLLQPNYTCPRDQLLEKLFADSDSDRKAGQLYVTIHSLKQVLREALGCEDAIIARGGVVKIGALLEQADVEKYRTLIRVGDQLWPSDRELAAELYEQAVQMYEELVPELSYIDWLDGFRNHYAEVQAVTLKRLVYFAMEKSRYDAAESYCIGWLQVRPAEEEAYQGMIRLLMRQGKTAEANRWYRKLEAVCREELNVTPLPETTRLLQGEGI